MGGYYKLIYKIGMRDLNKEESEKYIEIVKSGNMDKMADFAYELGLQDGDNGITGSDFDYVGQ